MPEYVKSILAGAFVIGFVIGVGWLVIPRDNTGSPRVLSVVSESMKNGISFQDNGTIKFTLNSVDLKSTKKHIEIPLRDVVLDNIKLDDIKPDEDFRLQIEYFYSRENGGSRLRITTDNPRYYGKVQLNYRTGEKETHDILFWPPS